MSIENIQLWHKRGRPDPTQEEFTIQLGCHFEEFAEMLETLNVEDDAFGNQALKSLHNAVSVVANILKHRAVIVEVRDRKEFLDSIADQVVTGIGAAHCAYMDGAEAVNRVNTSNWSKFDEHGQPIFNEHGKIAKGPKYAPPDLEGLY